LKQRYAIATALYCAGIFWLSSRTNIPSVGIPSADKVSHAILYAGLAALISTGIRRSSPAVSTRTQFIYPILFATLYGATDEFHQIFVPDRTCDVLDLLADFSGALLIQILLCATRWYARKHHSESRR
jgi:VanZ family protein